MHGPKALPLCIRCGKLPQVKSFACEQCQTQPWQPATELPGPVAYDAAEHRAETADWMRVQANEDRWGTSGHVSQ